MDRIRARKIGMTQPDLDKAIPHYVRYVKFFAAATGRTNGESLKSIVPMIIKDWPYDLVLCKAFLFRLAYALQQDLTIPGVSDDVRESWSFMRPRRPDAPAPVPVA